MAEIRVIYRVATMAEMVAVHGSAALAPAHQGWSIWSSAQAAGNRDQNWIPWHHPSKETKQSVVGKLTSSILEGIVSYLDWNRYTFWV